MKKLWHKLKQLFAKNKLCTVTFTYYVGMNKTTLREYQTLLWTKEGITSTSYTYFFTPPLVKVGKCTITDIKVDVVPTVKNYA